MAPRVPFQACAAIALCLASAAASLAAAPHHMLATCNDPIGDPMQEGATHDHRVGSQHDAGDANVDFVAFLSPPPSWDGIIFGPPIIEESIPEDDRGLFEHHPDDGHGHDHDAQGSHGTGGARFGEVDVRDGYAALAAISSPIGVWIVDVHDPAAPALVGRWNGPSGGYVTDVKWTSGGGALVASVQGSSQSGMFLIDASDKTQPKTSEFLAVEGGVHMMGMMQYLPVPGADVVFGATAYSNGVFPAVVTGDLPVKRFIALGRIPGIVAHDVWLTRDPLTLRTIMYVANSYGGATAFDVTDPTHPDRLGSWAGDGAYMHTVRAAVVGASRYVFVSPEYFFGTSSRVATLYVLDATDLEGSWSVVGTWRNPGGHAAGNLVFSTHAFQVVGSKVYLAHYHGGVWTLDVTAPAAPATLGHHMTNDHPSPPGGAIGWPVDYTVPSAWDVVLDQGHQYIGDITGGLYVLRYRCDETGPGGPTSVG